MNKSALSALVAAAVGALCSYFLQLAIPLAILLAAMVLDWVTGLSKAYVNKELSSQVGLRGILKKVGYIVVVCVAGIIDWLLMYGMNSIGIDAALPFLFAAVVTIWLIINELISILENVAAIGAPVPTFILKLLDKLKGKVEDVADSEDDAND